MLTRPFLAKDISQFDEAWARSGRPSEAVMFDIGDILDKSVWRQIQANLRYVSENFSAPLIVHFPINGANYVKQTRVQNRLWEVLDELFVLAVDGLVLHANQTRQPEFWTPTSVLRARADFQDFCLTLDRRAKGLAFWIGLENMPATGNDTREFDPVLVYPEDMAFVRDTALKLTIDFCHLSYTAHVSALHEKGLLPEGGLYPHVRPVDLSEVWELGAHVAHIHFSAFHGVASRHTRCQEGVLPGKSTLGEGFYADLYSGIRTHWPHVSTMTLEMDERDYTDRRAFPAMLKWLAAQERGSEEAKA